MVATLEVIRYSYKDQYTYSHRKFLRIYSFIGSVKYGANTIIIDIMLYLWVKLSQGKVKGELCAVCVAKILVCGTFELFERPCSFFEIY